MDIMKLLDYLERLSHNAAKPPLDSGSGDERTNVITGEDGLKITVDYPNHWFSEYKDTAEIVAELYSNREQLTRVLRIAVKALENVAEHQKFVGGTIHELSATYQIAIKALKEINADATH